MPAGGALTAAAIAGPIIGGVMGGMSASKGRKAASAAAAAAIAELEKVGMPPDLSKQLVLQRFQSEGILTPELEQDIHLEASQTAQIKESAGLRDAQMDALNTLGQVSRGGLRPEDRQAYNELRASTQRDSEAKRQQIIQQMQSRGMGSSGANLATQLQSAQASDDAQAAGSDRMAADASRRALEAISQRAQLAGGIRSQDFNVNQARAAALDDRNRFLYENSASRQRANINAQNQAQSANLASRQRLSEMNVGQDNAETQRQNQAKKDYWQDQLGYASAKANAINNQGSVIQQGANQQANMYSGIGNAIGQGAATYGNYQANKSAAKTDGSDYVPKFDGNVKYDANGNRIS
jgi:hypothetical protein